MPHPVGTLPTSHHHYRRARCAAKGGRLERGTKKSGTVCPHSLLRQKMRLLRFLFSPRRRGPHGRIHPGAGNAASGAGSPGRSSHGGQRVFRRGHAHASWHEAACPPFEGHSEEIPCFKGRGDYAGGQSRVRRGLSGAAGPAQRRLQPAEPWDAVRRR